METSDSECFESADEDFSNDEDTQTVKICDPVKGSKNHVKNDVERTSERLEVLKLSPEQPETKTVVVDDKRNKDTTPDPLLGAQEESNANVIKESKITNKKPRKEQNQEEPKEPKSKLGQKSKLGVKTVQSFEEKHDLEDAEKPLKLADPNKTQTEPVKPQESKVVTNEITEDEADLWGDDEDWGVQADSPPKESEEPEEEPNMWENDDWEPIENVKETPSYPTQSRSYYDNQSQPSNTQQSWGVWSGWDVSSLINTATQGVSTITQGISTALESGMGVPDPEEMARINKASKEKLASSQDQEPPKADSTSDHRNSSFGLGNFVMGVSHLTKLVESTGTKVISGGLDTLETIGKKTMEVLQEGDPGLKKKRAFLKIDQHKPVLSQLLREAKEKAESENRVLEERHYAKRAKNYETLFDDHQGLVHLEALEMLSKQCDIKLQSLLESYSDEALIDMQETMDQVKELCELPDEDEDEQMTFDEIKEKLESSIAEINIPISYKHLIETWEETETWIANLKLDICDEREIHQQAIETLAQLTAIAVEQFHKSAELLLVKEHRSTADEADSLVQLTTNLVVLIGIVAGKFSDKLNAKTSTARNKEEVNGLITNVFFEAANSSSYIQDAFQLLIPILQVGAV